jgi:hypothetical protein
LVESILAESLKSEIDLSNRSEHMNQLIRYATGALRGAQYRWWKIIRPEAIDFVSMGFGIESRKRRYEAFWQSHIRQSRGFIANALGCRSEGASRVAVLGSGRLYDINFPALLASFPNVDLYDADPTCRNAHKAYRSDIQNISSKIRFIERDLTGVMGRWSAQLECDLKSSSGSTAEIVGALSALTARKLVLGDNPESVVSLNLLGQIPLYWRDRVQEMLKVRCGIECDEQGSLPAPLQEALLKTMSALQIAHLEGLEGSGARHIVLLFDRSYCYYMPDRADWLEYDAIHCGDVVESLPSYQLVSAKEWWWDIVPPGEEGVEHGTAHRVCAYHVCLRGAGN